MDSETGSASGSVPVTFEPEPQLADVGFPVPDVVQQGQSVAFQVEVQNASATACNLFTNTTFRFGTFVDTLTAEVAVGGGLQVTLTFAGADVGLNVTPRQYEPVLTLRGIDQFGSPYTEELQLGEIVVSGVELAYVLDSLSPDVLSRGGEYALSVELVNNGVTPVTLESGTTLEFTDGSTVDSTGITQSTAIAAGGVPVTLNFGADTV